MSSRLDQLRPPYTVYSQTPIFGGDLPTIDEIGPPDFRPSGMNPAYGQYAGARGRHLLGLGATNMQSADPVIKDYANELNTLSILDDVQGNGVFDPPGSQGNIHPDQGVFADHLSIPGYIQKDRFYEDSVVIDGTTGEPVMYVPSGAVAIDQAQLDAIRERQLLWELPPGVSPQPVQVPDFADTWIPQEYGFPVSGLGAELVPTTTPVRSKGPMIAAFAIVGVAVGIFAATLVKPKRK